VHEGQIVLNVAPYATHQFEITNEAISCQARFGGVAQLLYVPLENILAIYAKENGRGLAFEPGMATGTAMELGGAVAAANAADGAVSNDAADASSPRDPEPPAAPPAGGSHLRVVK
jgi:stringent starvation protein B